MYGVLLKANDVHYLECATEGQIIAEETAKELEIAIQSSYDDCHKRGYESSMSAAVNFIFFQRSMIKLPETVQDLMPDLVAPVRVTRLSHISGFTCGLELLESVVERYIAKSLPIDFTPFIKDK